MTDQSTVADRHTPLPFAGYAATGGATVTVQAYNPTLAAYQNIGSATSGTSPFVWRGLNLYSWDAGSIFIPGADWQLSGGNYTAKVRAISSDGYTISSLKPDWMACGNNTTTAEEFRDQCTAASSPVANLTASSPNITLYVNGTVAVSGNGTQASPYKTIGEAITAANAYSGGRKRIEVASGYYVEHLTLSAGIDLVSPRVGAAIIHGGSSRDTGGFVTIIGANDSSVTGFVITGGYHSGVSLTGVSSRVSRNIIRGNYGSGISCTAGCTSLIENNTIIGQLHDNSGVSTGISVSASSAPVLRNNIIYRQDVGISRPSAAGSENYNLIYDNNTNFSGSTIGVGSLSVDPGFVQVITDDFRLSPASPARHAGDPATFNADSTRADMGAFDGNGGYVLSLPAQEWALESVFGTVYNPSGALTSNGSRTPVTGNPTFWFDSTIAGDPAVNALKAKITTAVAELSNNTAVPIFSSAAVPPADLCHVFQVTKTSSTTGTPYLDSWSIISGTCQKGASGSWGGRVTGGKLELAPGILTALLTAPPTDANVITVTHELGHAYGGIYHCFRTYSPIAYGPRPTDYGLLEQEALALRTSDVANYASTIPMADWLTKGYISQAALHPFPAVESFFGTTGTPPQFKVGTQVVVMGSRFTMSVSSEAGSASLPLDHAQPDAYFNDLEVDTTPAGSWLGEATRNLNVTAPASATSGWFNVRVRGLESIPVRVVVVP